MSGQKDVKPRISVVMNTYNAAEHLDRVLDALHRFDEIVVVDMHSTDATRDIAAAHGARIVMHEPCGICEPARNAAIQAATNDWVLIVDADELVTPQLADYLYQVAAKDEVAALRIPRRNFFMDCEMHCLYPDYVTRFARRDAIDWPPIIHAQPVIDGRIDSINSRRRELALLHLERNTISSRIEKMDRYTMKEVERRGPRRYNTLAFMLKPLSRFVRSYFLKGGWRDGQPGLLWASLEAQYKFTTMARQHEKAAKK